MLATYGLLASCYNLPTWQGDVVVHPLERAAIAQCGTGALTPAGFERIARHPYLQSTSTTGTTIVWGQRKGVGHVAIRIPGGDVIAKAMAEPAGPNIVQATFAGLEPTHLYCYQLFDGDLALTQPAPLTTAAAPGVSEPIRFVAVGDTGAGSPAQRAIAKRITEVPFDFALFLGDIAYQSGTAKQLEERFFNVYRDILRYVPAFPTIGNHERRTQKGRPYFDAFVLPTPERYYSFDWGDVHFVAIDTTHRDAAQLAWLDDDLRRTKQPWKIVFGHHTMYTSSVRTAAATRIRKAFAKILTDRKVDLVLTGHEHQYERFRVANVNYIVSGGGGARLMYFWGNLRALKQSAVHHFLTFEATAESLLMKAINIDGREIDTLHLEKGKPQLEQSPIAPEKKSEPDERIHDKPDDDTTKPRLPEQPVPQDLKESSQPSSPTAEP